MDEDWGVEPRLDARWARLRSLLVQPETVMTYVYDFGDDWEHRLVLSNIREGDPETKYPRFVAGERNAPPEDSGGLSGFYEKLEISADPQHPEHAEVHEWLGDYEPGRVDTEVITMELERIAQRREAARERARRRTS